MKHRWIYFCFLLLITLGCKKPFAPSIITNTPNYLVVEGVIVAGTDSTIIKLSRTVNISKKGANSPVTLATLSVESDGSTNYPLNEIKPGVYASPVLNLDNTKKYRLRIKTQDNQVYLSDFTAVSATPLIDSIGFTILNNGIQIYSNAHDLRNSTRYYRWDYEETWLFHSLYDSGSMTNGVTIISRPTSKQIYHCFSHNISSTIVLGSSAKLTQDVIYQNPIIFIPATSEKIEVRYSILLRQYALTHEAFTFWTNLKKNTEQLGSIFDAQPSQINGNIHNVNHPEEPVIGYISACTIQTKRIFIDRSQLPRTWLTTYPYSCHLDSFTYPDEVSNYLVPLGSYLIPVYYFRTNTSEGYMGADKTCVDCTIRGTTQQPSFWQ